MKRPLPRVREILSELSPLNGLPAASFGSYGWSGEAPDIIAEHLRGLGASLVEGQPLKVKEYPDETALGLCKDLGRTLANACKT
jgi:flavorubredoxin